MWEKWFIHGATEAGEKPPHEMQITSLDLPTKPSKSRSSQAKPSHSQVCEKGKQNKAQITLLSITAAATEQSRAVCRAKLNLLNRSLFFGKFYASISQVFINGRATYDSTV